MLRNSPLALEDGLHHWSWSVNTVEAGAALLTAGVGAMYLSTKAGGILRKSWRNVFRDRSWRSLAHRLRWRDVFHQRNWCGKHCRRGRAEFTACAGQMYSAGEAYPAGAAGTKLSAGPGRGTPRQAAVQHTPLGLAKHSSSTLERGTEPLKLVWHTLWALALRSSRLRWRNVFPTGVGAAYTAGAGAASSTEEAMRASAVKVSTVSEQLDASSCKYHLGRKRNGTP